VARQVSHIATFGTDEASPHSVRITDEKIEVKVGGMHGFTLHTAHGYPLGEADASLHNDIILAIGLALDRHGHRVEAAGVIVPFLAGARLSRKPEIALGLARCLAKANQMSRALEIAECFFGDDSTVDAAQIFLVAFFMELPSLLQTERDFGSRVLRRIAEAVERRGDNVRASTIHYNRASLLRGMHRSRDAIRCYCAAARLNPAYLDRSYFWHELAGVLFVSRRYALAARMYERSLAIEEHRLTRFLYADALMFTGKYQEAETVFEQNLASPVHPDDAEWTLKKFALSWLRELTGKDE
jgi:tetratricopeptide (TPR) repeat protein